MNAHPHLPHHHVVSLDEARRRSVRTARELGEAFGDQWYMRSLVGDSARDRRRGLAARLRRAELVLWQLLRVIAVLAFDVAVVAGAVWLWRVTFG